MASNVIMPALAMGQETGVLVRWLKAEGEAVEKGAPLMEVETDKAVVEVEAPASGILAGVTAHEYDEVPVGQVIARIVEPSELPGSGPGAATDGPQSPTAEPGSEALAWGQAARPPAAATGPARPALMPASPLARRLASERGIDLAAFRGSGPTGAVVAADVRAAAAEAPVIAGPQPAAPAPQSGLGAAEPRAWRVMAERMAASWAAAPHFYLMREVVASGLVEWRARIAPAVERRTGLRPTYTDLLVKVAAVALRAHARLQATGAEAGPPASGAIHVAIAIATDEALVAPVIHGVDGLSIGEIAARRQELVERAQAGRLTPADLADGAFTISNLGMYGVDAFSAIVTPPQAAILAVGRIADRVVAVDGQPAVRPTLILTLSCDHRRVDGARAAPFLDDLAGLIEEPWGLLA